MKKIISIIIYVLLTLSCDKGNDENLVNFDIDSKGKLFALAYKRDDSISITLCEIDEPHNSITIYDKDYSFYNPIFSVDCSKMFFIGYNSKRQHSSIWVYNLKDNSKSKIYEDHELIIEAIESPDNSKLYFTKAKDYTSYNSFSPKSAHNFDIYELNMEDEKIKQISHFNAYALYGLTNLSKNELLFSLNGEGVFRFKKDIKKGLEKVVTKNDTISKSTGYSNPLIVDDNNIVCISYYQLVNIDLVNKLQKEILPSNGYQFTQVNYCKGLKKIFFKKNDGTNKIYSVNQDGSHINEFLIR